MGIGDMLLGKIRSLVLPVPVRARHCEYSVICSADDALYPPTGRLLDIALESARQARGIDFPEVSSRMRTPPRYPEVWPGEHYKLLAGLVTVLRPACAVEVGTSTGLSALALKKFLPARARLATFDVLEWRRFGDTCLREEDFADGRLVQYVSDLSDAAEAERHAQLLASADLLFIDGPKDGNMERKLLKNFGKVGLKEGAVLVFDDIRLWNMLAIWRELPLPKLDLTSFGHWSGTGLAEWRK
ncbi:MAG: class I SAM-dependent methyltransferase [Elusimicrobia bacterium]|nr:class I SAM-dependent methyltransferase [Elusimicrobiota bacterium]